jgi:hypothetical protein
LAISQDLPPDIGMNAGIGGSRDSLKRLAAESSLNKLVLNCIDARIEQRSSFPFSEQIYDLFMSLIHTCQLCGVNSFDYLVELQRHARELTSRPAAWMPWNYRETLARTVSLPDSAELR